MAHLGRHAIVIGASMGGLLAARALADHYDEVTVLERDTLPEAHEPRKGVPQGRHAHGLLARGREILDQLFPGLSEEMVAQGAVYGDVVDEVLWFNHGVYLLNAPSALLGLLVSRPMLEDGVRRRLQQLANVRLLEHSDALEPVFGRRGDDQRRSRRRCERSGITQPGMARRAGLRQAARGGCPGPDWLHDAPVPSPAGASSRQAGRRHGRLPAGLAVWCHFWRRKTTAGS